MPLQAVGKLMLQLLNLLKKTYLNLLKTVGASSGAVLTVRTADRFPGARLFTKTVKRSSATGIGLISPEVTSSGVCVLGGEDVGGIESLPAFRRFVYL